jgi:hypothetical protein
LDLFGRLQYADRTIVTPMSAGLHVRPSFCLSCEWIVQSKEHTKILVALPDNLIRQLGFGTWLSLSEAVFDAKVRVKDIYPCRKNAFHRICTFTAAPKRLQLGGKF